MIAYEGKEPYIFISYAHKDADVVLPILDGMAEKGFRVWYDAGIEAGTEWPEYIATHLENAACVLAFLSKASINSQNCRQEINYAIDLDKRMLTVYLEEMTLTGGMRMRLGLVQAMFYHRHPSLDSFVRELARSELLSPCRKETDTQNGSFLKKLQAITQPTPTPDPAPTPKPTPTPEPADRALHVPTSEFVIEKGVLKRFAGGKKVAVIPEGVTVIGTEAFNRTEGLEKIIIPDSVTTIFSYAFANCPDLVEVVLPKKLGVLTSNCFINSGLQRVTVPEGVEAIGSKTFLDCKNLTEVSLPETLTTIGNETFRGCSSLKEIRLPAKLESMGELVFSGCSKLKKVYLSSKTNYVKEGRTSIPASVTLIFTDAEAPEAEKKVPKGAPIEEFYVQGGVLVKYLGKGKTVTVPQGVTSIGVSAFQGSAVVSVTLPKSVTYVGGYAFSSCASLEEVIITGRVSSIGPSAFSDCKKLRLVTLKEGLTKIQPSTFLRCQSLEKILIPSSVKTIGDGAFSFCVKLKAVSLSEGLEEIGERSFESCTSLESITVPSTVTAIKELAFTGCSRLKKAYVSKNAKFPQFINRAFPKATQIVRK